MYFEKFLKTLKLLTSIIIIIIIISLKEHLKGNWALKENFKSTLKSPPRALERYLDTRTLKALGHSRHSRHFI